MGFNGFQWVLIGFNGIYIMGFEFNLMRFDGDLVGFTLMVN